MSTIAEEQQEVAVRKTPKVFRPYRAAVRSIMKGPEDQETKTMIRGDTLVHLEDVALRITESLAKRMGTLVESGGRSKISLKDAEAALELEFGAEFAQRVMAEAVQKMESAGESKEEE